MIAEGIEYNVRINLEKFIEELRDHGKFMGYMVRRILVPLAIFYIMAYLVYEVNLMF